MLAKPEKTEIAVVGAGPAGVAAAVTAARAGARVTLLDEYARPGGQYYKQPAFSSNGYHRSILADNIQQGRELLADLEHPNINLQCDTLVWNITSEEYLLNLYGPAGARALQAKRIIMASGAYERVMPFPGWTLPGVTTVGSAQLLLKAQGVVLGQRLLLAGTGPLLQLAAVQLLEAGAEIVAIVELQSRKEFLLNAPRLLGQWNKIGQGLASQERLQAAKVPIKYGYAVARALGDEEVRGAVIVKVDGNGTPRPGSEETVEADTICLNFGFVPALELPRVAGCAICYDPHFGSFAVETNADLETSVPGLFAAGETRGIGGVEVALLEGQLAGAVAASQLSYAPAVDIAQLLREQAQARAAVEALAAMFPVKPGLHALATDEVVVCRCEEITAGAVREAMQMGVTQLNALKPWTRAGMGHCQGRTCGPIISQLVVAEAGLPLHEIEPFTARAPIKPVPMEAIGGPIEDERELSWEEHVTGYGMARTGQ